MIGAGRRQPILIATRPVDVTENCPGSSRNCHCDLTHGDPCPWRDLSGDIGVIDMGF